MSSNASRIAFIPPLLFALVVLPCSAAVFEVDSGLDVVDALIGDGLCATAAGACTLRAAIQEANATTAEDEIWLRPVNPGNVVHGVDVSAGLDEDFAATGDLDIRQPLQIRRHPEDSEGLVEIAGGFGLDAASERVFDIVAPAAVSFGHVVVAGGYCPHVGCAGAGLRVQAGAGLQFWRSVLYANFGHGPGTALAVFGNASLRESVVTDNHHTREGIEKVGGGTLYAGPGGSLEISDSIIIGNRNFRGAAVFIEDAPGKHFMRRLHLGGNDSGDISVSGAVDVLVENSTLASNGSVVAMKGANVSLQHVTFPTPLGAVFQFITDDSGATIDLYNSLVASGVVAPPCIGPLSGVHSSGGNVFQLASPCAVAMDASDRIVADLRLTAVQAGLPITLPGVENWAWMPMPDSPAIDAASPDGCPGLDQFSTPRPQQGTGGALCDSGAIEAPQRRIFGEGFEDT
jgi:hypothetical protein